jgi:hypothetical protein
MRTKTASKGNNRCARAKCFPAPLLFWIYFIWGVCAYGECVESGGKFLAVSNVFTSEHRNHVLLSTPLAHNFRVPAGHFAKVRHGQAKQFTKLAHRVSITGKGMVPQAVEPLAQMQSGAEVWLGLLGAGAYQSGKGFAGGILYGLFLPSASGWHVLRHFSRCLNRA